MHSKAHRMRRVFASDGRALIVAMDHAGYMGPVGGLIEPVATVRAVVAGGADAVMTTLGTAKRIASALDGRGLILSVDLNAADPVAVRIAVNPEGEGGNAKTPRARPLGVPR